MFEISNISFRKEISQRIEFWDFSLPFHLNRLKREIHISKMDSSFNLVQKLFDVEFKVLYVWYLIFAFDFAKARE